jgi:hypothetical protein
MSTGSTWRPVGSFERPTAEDNPVDAVDAGAGGTGGSRFVSKKGGRGIIVPVGSSAGAPIVLVPARPGTTEVLFVHPADAAAAVDLLALLGDEGRSVRVALPPGQTRTPGLVVDPSRSSVRLGEPPEATYPLFVLADPDRDRLASGPKPGESPGDIEARGRWFGSRHEGGD